MKEFNLNNCIKVRLSEEGRAAWLGQLVTFRKLTEEDYKKLENELLSQIDSEDYLKIPLWKFTQIFGPQMWNGKPELLFKDMVIQLDENELETPKQNQGITF